MRRVAGTIAAVLLLPNLQLEAQAPTPAADTANGWNARPALDLMQRARVRREQPRGDTALRNYSAKATGHVYFYLDRRESEERTLVKVDQIALDLYWAAPNLTKQKIVGLRDVSRLPNRQQYHLDHLTVVQNGFGDVIRLGDGDEVRDVPHPAARLSDSTYDFRLADSLTLTFAGQQPVRVYEVQVRPKHFNRSGLIGSVFIDQASADIVRMTFTFTPASYVDRRLDYINISLDNGLWNGNYWLPNEQYVEIRRQVPELDFIAGAVIRGRLRVHDYAFNQNLPSAFFYGAHVEALPKEQREAFNFAEEIYAGLDREGLAPPPQVAALRAQALALIRQQKLSGLPTLRLHIPNASSVLRYNRAEGTYLGAGTSFKPGGSLRYDGTVGYAFGTRHAAGSLAVRYENQAQLQVSVHGYANQIRDIGVRPTMPGALNTLTSFFGADDYFDPFFASGARIELGRPLGVSWRIDLQAALEQQRSARLELTETTLGDQRFRPVREIEDGTLAAAEATLVGPLLTHERFNLTGTAAVEAGLWKGTSYVRPTAALELNGVSASHATSWLIRASGGTLSGRAPAQTLFLMGGRGTLPGYPYRNLTGNAFWLIEAEASREVLGPLVRLRATAAHGGVRRPDELPAGWPASRTSGTSVGIGVGLIYDIIRLDLVRGGSHSPRLYFSIKPDFWDML